ncbi:MAG: DUF11 domain-containing protein [Verrucomicrobiae bacterium]|nr:DUF11 domain-containing protein [Verrucomicrobiae bacterium]
MEGGQVVWKLGDIDANQTVSLKVWLKADKEGNLVNCATVSGDPRACGSTFIGKATLAIEKTGPETAVLGSDVTYNIVVKNTGTAVAKDVVLTDPVPDGLTGQPVTLNLGDIAPGQSKPATVTFKANKRGKFCNVAKATSSNAGGSSDDACTTVLVPGLKVEKTGAGQILGRSAPTMRSWSPASATPRFQQRGRQRHRPGRDLHRRRARREPSATTRPPGPSPS